MIAASKGYEVSILKSMLLMLGAYTFSYCLGLTFHETGHALAYLIVGGISDIEIHVNPFTNHMFPAAMFLQKSSLLQEPWDHSLISYVLLF